MPSVKELEINNTVYDVKGKTVVDNNSGELSFWSGSKAQYDAIVTKDANTLYNITDDTDVSLTILETLYPVGSVYITTNATCPLSTLIAGSTWVAVGSGRVLQGADSDHSAGTTVEAGLPNITGLSTSRVRDTEYVNGAFTLSNGTNITGSWTNDGQTLYFDASRSNSIYGNSTTVQPPAYVVNIFERTA